MRRSAGSLLSGRAADLLGRRRVFLGGVALFGAASLACGLAQEPWQLVTGRFAQGAGAAPASPAALSMIVLLFPGTGERARALGVWGGVAALPRTPASGGPGRPGAGAPADPEGVRTTP